MPQATDEQYREAAYAKMEGIEHVQVETAALVEIAPGNEEYGGWVTATVWVTHDEATATKASH